jgi:hypothetical protein
MGKQLLLRAMMLACAASIAAVSAGHGNEFRSNNFRGDRDRDDRFRHCDPRSYGAVNDGKTDNTTALQTAIDRCAQSGGVVSITAAARM